MFALEVIGTIAFAITGVLVSVESKLDIFGVVFIGCITAVGGGMTRDVFLGITPPSIFSNKEIFLVAFFVSAIAFVFLYSKDFFALKTKIEYINNIFDAIGLGVFSITGAEVACLNGYTDNVLLVIISGMITGIGGGIFRDILTSNTPYVLKKHVYALASIAGVIIYYIIKVYVQNLVLASVVAILSVIVIRLLATHYRWKLPKIKIDRQSEK